MYMCVQIFVYKRLVLSETYCQFFTLRINDSLPSGSVWRSGQVNLLIKIIACQGMNFF